MDKVKEKSLVASILSYSKLPDDDYSYAIATQGMQTILRSVLEDTKNDSQIRVDKRYVEKLIDELDSKLSLQMDEIIHHPTFQQLESPWRSLKLLTERTDFQENIKIEFSYESKSGQRWYFFPNHFVFGPRFLHP